ncbi:MAG TPA: hypothetical protein VF720_01085, partial [Candidatus Eisenbacteria bacterium]
QGSDGSLYYLTYFGALRRISYPLAVSAAPETAPRPPLVAARPNPFHAGGTTRFDGMESERTITIYDTQGRLVRKLDRPEWDGVDSSGRPVRAGRYFAVASSGRRVGVVVTR